MTYSKAISKDRFDAVLFDLDGVITATAKVHAACWKKMFDEFLLRRPEEPFEPFDIQTDYPKHIDGKLREDGVRSFLQSRGIYLPEGDSAEPPNYETVQGLGKVKDRMFKKVLREEGIEVYEGAVELVNQLRSQGIKTAVVSASKNCKAVLEAASLDHLFDVRVDGEVANQLELPGKPAPDKFLKAAQQLGVEPERAVVVEDAISGVQAGRDGGFGLVVGVDRKGQAEELRENGAHIVVPDPGELL
ncbi:MAG: beta-phosphoglucomutase family hydrolase [Deltaproteobacteria bacterium]|jgi:beta-phosphoglucomutase family hydrolase